MRILKIISLFSLLFLLISVKGQRFAAIGDFGDFGPNSQAVARLVKSWEPAFIITLGDNNYPDGEAEFIDENVGQLYSDYIYPYKGKYGTGATTNRFYPSLGNHDLGVEDGQAYYDYFQLPNNERYYDFIEGDIHFFVLNSNYGEEDGLTYDSKQAQWLHKAMQNSTSNWKLVYFHHPPYSSGPHKDSEWMRWPFEDWGADLILNGHDHIYERLEVNGLTYITCGVGGASIYDLGSTHPNSLFRYDKEYGALHIEINNDTLEGKFININGELIDQFILSKKDKTEGLFDREQILKMRLEADFNKMLDAVENEEEEIVKKMTFPGEISYADNKGNIHKIPIQLKARGNSRLAFCDFPPIKLYFDHHGQEEDALFGEYDMLKVVTHCMNYREKSTYSILQEYLIYKILNELTDNSFKVRLVNMNYVDLGGFVDDVSGYAFFIESSNRMGKRISASKIPDENLTEDLRDKEAHFLSLFEFMIGNNDWYLPSHNVKMFRSKEGDTIAIPYDFDLSDIAYIYQLEEDNRHYKGPCPDKEELNRLIVHFNSRKKNILGLFREFPYLTENNRNLSINYIERFFDIINDPLKLESEILSYCRKFKARSSSDIHEP